MARRSFKRRYLARDAVMRALGFSKRLAGLAAVAQELRPAARRRTFFGHRRVARGPAETRFIVKITGRPGRKA